MQQINNLTDDADQKVAFTLLDGSTVQLEFIYRPAIQRWSMNLSHPTLTLNGYNLSQHPNILRPWRNVINFGMAIVSKNGLDPIRSTDFLDETSAVYILSAAEVQLVEVDILSPIPLVNP